MKEALKELGQRIVLFIILTVVFMGFLGTLFVIASVLSGGDPHLM